MLLKNHGQEAALLSLEKEPLLQPVLALTDFLTLCLDPPLVASVTRSEPAVQLQVCHLSPSRHALLYKPMPLRTAQTFDKIHQLNDHLSLISFADSPGYLLFHLTFRTVVFQSNSGGSVSAVHPFKSDGDERSAQTLVAIAFSQAGRAEVYVYKLAEENSPDLPYRCNLELLSTKTELPMTVTHIDSWNGPKGEVFLAMASGHIVYVFKILKVGDSGQAALKCLTLQDLDFEVVGARFLPPAAENEVCRLLTANKEEGLTLFALAHRTKKTYRLNLLACEQEDEQGLTPARRVTCVNAYQAESGPNVLSLTEDGVLYAHRIAASDSDSSGSLPTASSADQNLQKFKFERAWTRHLHDTSDRIHIQGSKIVVQGI